MNATGNQHTSTEASSRFPVVIYDLECVLCNFWVRVVLRFDRRGRIRFAHAGSAFVGELMQHRPDLNPSDGVMLWEAGSVYQGMDAVLRIASVAGGMLRVVWVMRLCPGKLRAKLYHWVARNRYAWFGKREPVCDLSLQRRYSDRFVA